MLAAKDLGLSLPLEPPWWQRFGVELKEAELIAAEMQRLYGKKPPAYVEVPRRKREAEPQTPAPSPPEKSPEAPPKSSFKDGLEGGATEGGARGVAGRPGALSPAKMWWERWPGGGETAKEAEEVSLRACQWR